MRPGPLRTSLVVFVFLILFTGTASAAWSGITQLTSSARNSVWSNNIFDSNGNLHLTYNEWITSDPVYREVFYMKLDNNGNKLINEKRITAYDLEDSKCPIAEVDSDDNVHMVFCDFRDGNWETYYVKLDNDGNNLTKEIRLGFSGQDSSPDTSPWPVHAIDSNGNVHVVWTDRPPGSTPITQRDLYYAKLDNNGNILVNNSRLTSSTSYAVNSAPAIDSAGNVHIVWRDNISGNSEIYYTKLDNNGSTLVPPTRRTNAAGDAGSHPWIVVDSDENIGIVWPDARTGNRDIYYMKLDNNGTKLIGDIQLTTDSTDASFAGTITTSTPIDSDDNIHIAWGEKKPSTKTEIYYMKIDNSGNILTSELRLTYTPNASEKGGIHTALDPNGDPHITWATTDILGSNQVFYTYQIGAVTTAAGREYQITNAPGKQIYAYIHENRIVYMSEESDGSSDYNIIVHDMGPDGIFNTGDDSERIVANVPNYDEFYPDIYGDLVPYAVGAGNYPHAESEDTNISLFNLETNTTAIINDAPRYQCCPQIYNITVTWHDRRATGGYYDIYLYDLGPDGVYGGGDDGGEFVVTNISGVNQEGPQIWGRNLVWTDGRNGNGDIYLYDAGPDGRFNTGDDRGEFQVTTDPATQGAKDVREHMIVWADNRSGDFDIYGYDMGPDGIFNTTDDVSEFRVTDNAADQKAPRVSANTIVWRDTRNGDTDVYIYDLGPDEIFNTIDDGGEIMLFNDSYNQHRIEMYDGKIVYEDKRDGDKDIYMFVLGLVITVCPSGCDHTSIQAAINAASNNDTILVEAGDYNENVDVNKSVNLVGAGARVTSVQAASSSDHIFNVTANSVNISGFTVMGATDSGYAGIYLSNNYSRIGDINASNNNYGIYLDSSSGNTIYNDLFDNTNNFYFAGTIYGNDWSITRRAGTNIVGGPYLGGNFWANPSGTGFSETCTDADSDGICDSGYTLASGNVDYLPLSPISCGYTLYTDTVLTGNLSGCTGNGLVIGADDITLDCAGYGIIGAAGTNGIYVSGRDSVTVKNCVLKNFDRGIVVFDSDNSAIINNAITDNWGILGIGLQYSDYSVIANNSVSSKSAYGIVQYVSNYNTISDNAVTGNLGKGIYISGRAPIGGDPNCTSHSNISGNVVSHNGYGIYLDDEDNNLVTGNYVYNNTYGIYLNYSWLNYVYDNYLNNTNNAYDTGSPSGSNYWNTTKTAGTNIVGGSYLGGNYWSDYTGTDTDVDGIGDTALPYNASGDITGDWLPLVPLQYYNISLNTGWNLISIPLIQKDWSIPWVLYSIRGNYSVVFAYIDDVWEKSTAARDPLTNMSLEYGYWIYMTAPDILELNGTMPATTTINIVGPRWNLVGYPSFTTRNITDVLSGCNYAVVFAYIDEVWEMTTAARDPLAEMTPGFGYWIYANDACSYEVTNFS